MTDYSMKCGEKCVREYVVSQLSGNSVKTALPLIICASMLTVMPLLGVIGYIMTQSIAMLIVTGCALVIDVGIIIFLNVMINSTSKKLMEAYSKQDGLVCSVSEQQVVIVHDNRPVRTLSWDKLSEVFEGKNAFFLKEGENSLIILDKSAVLSGSVQETSEIIAKITGEEK
ncbi:MAG: hypothetical protein IK093_08585 [Ruminiclostridium sp.]|nr:hypothetical protein [Ruminiclostridium sp.]